MIPAKQLLGEIAESLRKVIAPAIAEPFPKAQAFMAAVILEFVARQVEERSDIADEKQEALGALFGGLSRLKGVNGIVGKGTVDEAELCRLIERLYGERERLGEEAFGAANGAIRETLRKLLDQELKIAGKGEG
jgi:hypothetical protein